MTSVGNRKANSHQGIVGREGGDFAKNPSFKVRKTPSGDRHIIKSNSVSQTLGGK